MRKQAKKIGLIILLSSPALYISTCSYISNSREKAFELVRVGDTQEAVINQFGVSYVQENAGAQPFLRYATTACQAPCNERWWFENRLSFDTSAWSVEFGSDKRVITKTQWASP
jgi:hypothetical protein